MPQYDPRQQAVQVRVSSLQPPSAVALVAPDGTRYPAASIARTGLRRSRLNDSSDSFDAYMRDLVATLFDKPQPLDLRGIAANKDDSTL
jgi:hypothetical protein